MTYRVTGALLGALGFLCASADLAAAQQGRVAAGVVAPVWNNQAMTKAKSTTVKSSKSNTSDRMGGGGGAKGASTRNNVGGNESGQQSRGN
jgi:hypothetical protein